jgi:hypothetical protein
MPVEIETQGADVLLQLRVGLLETHEDAGLAVLQGAADEELHAQQGLAAAGAAADERGPPLGQPAAGDFIEPLDAGGAFFQFQVGAEFFVRRFATHPVNPPRNSDDDMGGKALTPRPDGLVIAAREMQTPHGGKVATPYLRSRFNM